MVCASSWMCAIAVLLTALAQSQAQSSIPANETPNKTPIPNTQDNSNFAEEVVVESSLNVRNPSIRNPINRRVRDVLYYLVPDVPSARVKRQFQPGFGGQGIGGPGFGQGFPNQFKPPSYDNSQSTAQSNSHSNYFGPNGSQNADALAAAQAFQASGPLGSFGATANNAATNTLNIGPNGATGGFSNAGGQTYTLPNGHSLNIAYNNGVSFGPNGRPASSQGSAISYTR